MSVVLLDAVAASGLLAIPHARRVQSSPDHLVTHTWEILHTPPTNQHDAVFLEVVAFTGM
jgi:hypothetical protein